MKLPNFPPAFLLNIQLNANTYFSTSFGSLEDLANKKVWQAACDGLHEHLVKWLEREALKEEQSAQERTDAG